MSTMITQMMNDMFTHCRKFDQTMITNMIKCIDEYDECMFVSSLRKYLKDTDHDKKHLLLLVAVLFCTKYNVVATKVLKSLKTISIFGGNSRENIYMHQIKILARIISAVGTVITLTPWEALSIFNIDNDNILIETLNVLELVDHPIVKSKLIDVPYFFILHGMIEQADSIYRLFLNKDSTKEICDKYRYFYSMRHNDNYSIRDLTVIVQGLIDQFDRDYATTSSVLLETVKTVFYLFFSSHHNILVHDHYEFFTKKLALLTELSSTKYWKDNRIRIALMIDRDRNMDMQSVVEYIKWSVSSARCHYFKMDQEIGLEELSFYKRLCQNVTHDYMISHCEINKTILHVITRKDLSLCDFREDDASLAHFCSVDNELLDKVVSETDSSFTLQELKNLLTLAIGQHWGQLINSLITIISTRGFELNDSDKKQYMYHILNNNIDHVIASHMYQTFDIQEQWLTENNNALYDKLLNEEKMNAVRFFRDNLIPYITPPELILHTPITQIILDPIPRLPVYELINTLHHGGFHISINNNEITGPMGISYRMSSSSSSSFNRNNFIPWPWIKTKEQIVAMLKMPEEDTNRVLTGIDEEDAVCSICKTEWNVIMDCSKSHLLCIECLMKWYVNGDGKKKMVCVMCQTPVQIKEMIYYKHL